MKDKDPATRHVISAERRRFVCKSFPSLSDWLTTFRVCSKDAVADERVVNDAYVPQVNAFTPCKAKAEGAEDAMLPKEKTSA